MHVTCYQLNRSQWTCWMELHWVITRETWLVHSPQEPTHVEESLWAVGVIPTTDDGCSSSSRICIVVDAMIIVGGRAVSTVFTGRAESTCNERGAERHEQMSISLHRMANISHLE